MRICVICDSIYFNDTDECKECKDGGELVLWDNKDNI